jgi:carboxypeptidase Taq
VTARATLRDNEPMSTATPCYDGLHAAHSRLHRFAHLGAMAGWDQAANMPPGGAQARAAALAELAALMHRLRTDPKLGSDIACAEHEPLSDEQRANLREIRRDWHHATALPEALVQRQQIVTARCEHAWRAQRPANDWAGFVANFREVLALVREQAGHLAERSGLKRYDALLDVYEPGMTSAELDRIFGDLRGWLPDLIARVRERQSREPVVQPVGPFPVAAQRELSLRVTGLLGFDLEAGRIDVSTHPFCGGVPEDVRLTTRYDESDFVGALMGTIHETGHGRYEQNLPRDWLGQPIAQARSAAIHESQSLSFEMQLGCHPAFVRRLAPMLVQAFGAQPAFEPANLQRLMNRVKPGLIRVDADELTYPAHILLRYEIERKLVEGEIGPDDIPALWDERMRDLLGLDTRGNYKDGPLQDVHWPSGVFGYFPSYSLGAMYAAQWFAAMRRRIPDLDDRIGRGDLAAVFDWLRENIWQQASRWTTAELALRATGEALAPAHFKAHLEARYLG